MLSLTQIMIIILAVDESKALAVIFQEVVTTKADHVLPVEPTALSKMCFLTIGNHKD